MPREVIEDYYGTGFEVEPVFKSNDAFVYMDRDPALDFREEGAKPTMDRFTPEAARNLATQLNEAADEAEATA
jgi:hypothetical protein